MLLWQVLAVDAVVLFAGGEQSKTMSGKRLNGSQVLRGEEVLQQVGDVAHQHHRAISTRSWTAS